VKLSWCSAVNSHALTLDSGADVHITPSLDNMTNLEILTAADPYPAVVFPPLLMIRGFGNNIGSLIYDGNMEILGLFSQTYECMAADIRRMGYFCDGGTMVLP
jgi:hypothetical protein